MKWLIVGSVLGGSGIFLANCGLYRPAVGSAVWKSMQKTCPQEIKWLHFEADHSYPSSGDTNMMELHNPIPTVWESGVFNLASWGMTVLLTVTSELNAVLMLELVFIIDVYLTDQEIQWCIEPTRSVPCC